MDSTKRHTVSLPVVARIGAWLLGLATVITGIALFSTRTVDVWTQSGSQENYYTGDVVDVTGIGLALICVGLVMLMAVLLFEASRKPS